MAWFLEDLLDVAFLSVVQICLGLRSLQAGCSWCQMARLSPERRRMSRNRVHLFEFCHVNITKSTNLTLRLSNLSTFDVSIPIPDFLLLSFSCKFSFDP
jgi:hypothetical protein